MSHWTTLEGTLRSCSQDRIILGNIIFLNNVPIRLKYNFWNTLYRAYLHLKLVGFKLIRLNGELVYPPQGSEEGFIWTVLNEVTLDQYYRKVHFCSNLRDISPEELLPQVKQWLKNIQELNGGNLYGTISIDDGNTYTELELDVMED